MQESPRRPERFREALAGGGLIFDGAMGTALHERGIPYDRSFDHITLSRPELVKEVHDAYLQVGAGVLSTNSFGANRFRLAAHSLEREVATINRAAVSIAREAARENAFVCASVGPTGLTVRSPNALQRDAIRAAFFEQCVSLAAAGADAIILETFRQPDELRLALDAAREACAEAIPVIASVSFDPIGVMADGTAPERIAEQLALAGASALGVNCADGPVGLSEMVSRMLGPGLPIVAQPSAGLPHRLDGRFVYRTTPDDFGEYAQRLFGLGVKAVGGCCGTTPAHLARISRTVRPSGAGDSIRAIVHR